MYNIKSVHTQIQARTRNDLSKTHLLIKVYSLFAFHSNTENVWRRVIACTPHSLLYKIYDLRFRKVYDRTSIKQQTL